jgi:hypothetical protein
MRRVGHTGKVSMPHHAYMSRGVCVCVHACVEDVCVCIKEHVEGVHEASGVCMCVCGLSRACA